MVSALVSLSGGLGSSPGQGHCVVSVLGRARHLTLDRASTGEFNAGGNPAMD